MNGAVRAAFVCATAAGLFVVVNCGEVQPSLDNGARCSLNSDCRQPLVCGFERCRTQCATSRDCAGKLCVRGDGTSGVNVCQLDDEIECSHNSQCPGTQVCGPDRHCRDVCVTDKDCITDLLCISRVCAKPEELVNGALPLRSQNDAGSTCVYASDCPGDLVCLYGRCDLECLGDKDCRVGWECQLAARGGDGRCYPRGALADAGGSDGRSDGSRDGASSPDAATDGSTDGSADGADGADGAPPSMPLQGLVAGQHHSCAILNGGKVKCWGSGVYGQLGLGDTATRGDTAGEMGDALPYVDLGTGRTAKSLTAGYQHTCAVLDNDQVKCWGFNSAGQLGLGDMSRRGDGAGEMGDALPYVDLGTGRTAKQVSAGNDHTCAVLDNDTVKCWGSNTNGKLGLGDTATRGDGAGEMGDALPVVALGTGRSAKAVVAREFHTCALLDNDQIKCWGDNSAGQLGLGDKNNRGASAGTMGDALLSANLGTGRTAKLVTAGIAYTCAILDDDKVKCWGSNSFGQLGLGDLTVRGDNAGEMGDALAYVDLGTGRTATWLSAFNGHTCATLDNGKVKCWGYNGVGNLGLGDTSTRGDAAGEMGDTLGFAEIGTGRSTSYVSCGYGHTCVSLDDGNVKCWGSSGYGQLGLGVQTDRGAGPNQMGDNLPNVKLTGP